MTDRNLHAGEVGRQLVYPDVQEDLTGATAHLRVLGPGEDSARDLPMSITGRTLSRETLETDFPVPGRYELQVIATWPDRVLKGDVHSVLVRDNLP